MSADLLTRVGELCWPISDLRAKEPAMTLLLPLAAALADRFWESDWFVEATRLPENDGTLKAYLREARAQPWEPFERVAFFFRFYRCAHVHAVGVRRQLRSVVPREVVLQLRSGAIRKAVDELGALKQLADGQRGARSAARAMGPTAAVGAARSQRPATAAAANHTMRWSGSSLVEAPRHSQSRSSRSILAGPRSVSPVCSLLPSRTSAPQWWAPCSRVAGAAETVVRAELWRPRQRSAARLPTMMWGPAAASPRPTAGLGLC